jgi:hypothetical protein
MACSTLLMCLRLHAAGTDRGRTGSVICTHRPDTRRQMCGSLSQVHTWGPT